MSLGNISPFNRTWVDQIQLVGLCLEKNVIKFGFKKIFEVIMRDICHLETTGIELQNKQVVKGTIIAVVGDNLGNHQIGGFLENFSLANFFVVIVMLPKQRLKKISNAHTILELEFLMRLMSLLP